MQISRASGLLMGRGEYNWQGVALEDVWLLLAVEMFSIPLVFDKNDLLRVVVVSVTFDKGLTLIR